MIGVLTARHVLIITGLLSIGTYWLALIPATILIVLLGYMVSARQFDSWKEEGSYLIRQVAFLGAWSLFIVGSWSFGDVIGDQNYWGIGLVGVQLLGWIIAIVWKQKEAITLFHRGYYLSSILVFIGIGGDIGRSELIGLIASWGRLTIGLYAFIIFVMGGIGYRYDNHLENLLWIYVLVELVYLVMIEAGDSRMIGVLLSMLGLLLVTRYLHGFQRTATKFVPIRDEDQEDFYALLYDTPKVSNTPQKTNTFSFLDPLGQRMFDSRALVISTIAITMTVLLAATMIRVSGQLLANQLISLYAIMFTYCGGRIITRQRSDDWHRGRWITLVGVITLLYFTIVQWFGSESLIIVIASVPISIGLSGFLLYEAIGMQKPLFDMADRRAWLSGVVLITILISILFFRLPFSNQLIFALLCMYLGVQGMIIRYTRRASE